MNCSNSPIKTGNPHKPQLYNDTRLSVDSGMVTLDIPKAERVAWPGNKLIRLMV